MPFFNTLVLLGAIQGFITSILLFRRKKNVLADRLLGVLIFLIALACLNTYINESGLTFNSAWWSIFRAIVPMIVTMPIGPLIYFYTKALNQPSWQLSRQDKRHFAPVLLDIVPDISTLIYVVGALLGFFGQEFQVPLGSFIDSYNNYVDIPRWLSISTYLYLAYREKEKANYTSIRSEQTIWVNQFLLGFVIFQLTWLIFLVPYVIPATTEVTLAVAGWYPVYVPLMVLVYWLCIRGYVMNQFMAKQGQSSSLNEKEVSSSIGQLEAVMLQEKLFLNPSLQLADVIAKTGMPQKTISAVLNQHVGKSFNEYINGFRVEEVKNRLLDESFQHLTITGIAFDCGFNSQATFQRAFKSVVGKSPSQFRKENLAEKKVNTAQS